VSDYAGFVYVFEGSISIEADSRSQVLEAHKAGVTSDGDEIVLRGGEYGGRALLIAGRPLHEPVAQYGPFVMNTREEVEQAVRDYQNGTLTTGGVAATQRLGGLSGGKRRGPSASARRAAARCHRREAGQLASTGSLCANSLEKGDQDRVAPGAVA
jgi:hypothetical protein